MELPELMILGRQMEKEVVGRKISEIEVSNPKCLNVSIEELRKALVGKTIGAVESRGKWLFMRIKPDNVLLFNPGMGADVIHFKFGDKLPERYQIRIVLDDETGFTVRVWWFCYLHLVRESELAGHKMVGSLGLTPLDQGFTLDHFKLLLSEGRGNMKSFLLDQKSIAGIGNVYVHDILFSARIHPKRKISTLTDEEIVALYNSVRTVLNNSIKLGGLAYEKDFYGIKGGYGIELFKVAYKEGKPCPICRTTIQKIKTGSTSSFICPKCQPINK